MSFRSVAAKTARIFRRLDNLAKVFLGNNLSVQKYSQLTQILNEFNCRDFK